MRALTAVQHHRRTAITGLLVAVSLFAAACGDDDDSSSAGSTAAATAEAAAPSTTSAASGESDIVAKAQAEVAKRSDLKTVQASIPKPAETDTFDPGTGTAQIVSCSQAAGGCRSFSKLITEALTDMGWKVLPTYDGAFDPGKEAAGINQAVQKKVDALVLVSVEYNVVKAAVDNARANNIPIVCFNCVSGGYKDITDVGQNGTPEGESIAWYIVANTQGKANVVGFLDKAYNVVINRFKGIQSVFDQCTDCKYKQVEVSGADIAKPGPPQWTAALQADPDLDFGIPPYDAFVQAMSGTAKQHGGDVTVSGNDGYPEVLEKMVLPGSNIPDNYVSAIPYAAYATADLVGRKAKGLPVWENSGSIPALLVTAETAKQYLPSGYYDPGFDFKAYFHKLWGT